MQAERSNPQADVWWGNEVFHTINLAENGVLAPYESPSATDIPARFKDPGHRWAGSALLGRVCQGGTKAGQACTTDANCTGGGTCPLLLLWSAEDGSLVAVVEAFALGNLRTGGISGVASDWMARQDAKVMAIVGTGKQALAQLGAILAVRPIERLQIYSPRTESRQAFAGKARGEFGLEAASCASVSEA